MKTQDCWFGCWGAASTFDLGVGGVQVDVCVCFKRCLRAGRVEGGLVGSWSLELSHSCALEYWKC